MSEKHESYESDEGNSAVSTSVSGHTLAPTTSEGMRDKKPGLLDRIVWAIMRIALVTPTLEEVRTRKYNHPRKLPTHTISDSQAQFLFELAESSSDHTDDKIKQLLTLSSSLIAVLALFGGSVRPRIFVALVAFTLLVSVLMCVMALGVRQWSVPEVSDVREAPDSWATDLLNATYDNRAFHSFRVDQYRCSLRYFVCALIATGLLALLAHTEKPTDELGPTLRDIRDNGLIMRAPPPPIDVPPLWSHR